MNTCSTTDEVSPIEKFGPQKFVARRAAWFHKTLSIVLFVAIIGLIGSSVKMLLWQHQLPNRYHLGWLLAGAILAVGYRWVNAYGWVLVLRCLNQQVRGRDAIRVWMHAESRRWLPGSIWGYTSRVIEAKKIGVPTSITSASLLLELLFIVVAAGLVVLPGAIVYRTTIGESLRTIAGPLGVRWVGFGFLLIVVATWFGKTHVLDQAKRLQSRFRLLQQRKFQPRQAIRAIAFITFMGVVNGGITYCLMQSFVSEPAPLLVVIAATSLAWLTGFVAVFSPGGIMVREVALATLLLPWLPYSSGMILAILARLLQIGAEIVGIVWVVFAEPKRRCPNHRY